MKESSQLPQIAAGFVGRYWDQRVALGEMTPSTRARYGRVLQAFDRFISAHGRTLETANAQNCAAFVHAVRRREALPPAPSTARFRLTVIRDAYAALGIAGLVANDPTAALRVDHHVGVRTTTPLTPAEVARLRAAGRTTPRDHLRPAAVELALAGASHEEIARRVFADIDFENDVVRLGNRVASLDPFARSTLTARMSACRLEARRRQRPWLPEKTPVALRREISAYPPTSIAPGISSSLVRAMRSAGLNRPGVRPASIREFGANRVYAQTGRIEDVADFLGLASLDTARGFIDHAWQEAHGEEVRVV